MSPIAPYDRELLRRQFQSATPFPWVSIDGFLNADFAARVAGSYPAFGEAVQIGQQFKAVNENLKVQVSDYKRFPEPVRLLADALAAPMFLGDLAYITGIPNLVWDAGLAGGGMHQTAKSGWLDVHVDFNFNEEMSAHRRLNIILFLNPDWEEEWGGTLELWDDAVQHRPHALTPKHNRCVMFATSERSWHGVTAVDCPRGMARKSFAAYYYTREAPANWDGTKHSTIFKPRPTEYMKRYVSMPASWLRSKARNRVATAKRAIKALLLRGK